MHVTDLAGGGKFTAGEWPVLVLFVLAAIYITVYTVRRSKKDKMNRQKEQQERNRD